MPQTPIKKGAWRCPTCNKAGTSECSRVECGNRKQETVGEPGQGYVRICGGFKRVTSNGGRS